jgi:putative nucleotidyltransferase with HDIG domain
MKIKLRRNYLIIIGLVILLNIVFSPPRMAPRTYTFEKGEIAPYDVIAPYDFDIPVSEQELYEEKQEITKRIPPIYRVDNTIPQLVQRSTKNLTEHIDSLKAINDLSRDSIIAVIQRTYAIDRAAVLFLIDNNYARTLEQIAGRIQVLYKNGIVDSKPPGVRIITIINSDKEIIETIDRMYSFTEAESLLTIQQPPAYKRLIQFFLRPDIVYDNAATQARIDEVFANVPRTKGKVLKGELIIEKHKRLTEESLEILATLESTYISIGTWEIVKTLFFRNVLYVVLALFLFAMGRLLDQEFYKGKNLFFVILLFTVYLIIGKLAYMFNVIYLVPIALFIYIIALYFNTLCAIAFTVVFAALFGVVNNDLSVFVFLATSGFVATFSVRTISSRLSLYRPMSFIAAANVAAIVFIDIYLLKGSLSLIHIGEGVINGIIGSFFFVLLLPLFERVFDFTTDLTLLELGNLNLPMFKEMAIEAPGTYHHSIVTGSLAEAGARFIGADPILARVGAYYHDIGKLKKPEYFIENQIGIKNPHDSLKPQISVLIIISHVKEGIDMAKKMKLPRSLINIIEQHHGTTSMEIFYNKALKQMDTIQEDAFRYPGPKPKTKEAAIVMLADSVEASARSDKNITVTKLQKIIKETITRKFNDGQLDDCPVTRQDLEQLKTAFLSTLTGVYHPRVEYTDAEAGQATPSEG